MILKKKKIPFKKLNIEKKIQEEETSTPLQEHKESEQNTEEIIILQLHCMHFPHPS